jgi:hypothetical protein
MGEGGARGGASLEEASVGLSARVGKLCSSAMLFFPEVLLLPTVLLLVCDSEGAEFEIVWNI